MRKVILMLTISAFASSIVNAAIVSNSIIVDDIEYYMQVDDSVYSLGEDVEMLYRVTNLGAEEWRIVWGFPVFDVIVEEKDGENFNEIWSFSWDKFHPTGPIVVTLEPQESMELNEIWPQINLNDSGNIEDHTQVLPGVFRISGVCYPTDTYVAVDINIAPEPCSLVLLGLGGLILRKKSCR